MARPKTKPYSIEIKTQRSSGSTKILKIGGRHDTLEEAVEHVLSLDPDRHFDPNIRIILNRRVVYDYACWKRDQK